MSFALDRTFVPPEFDVPEWECLAARCQSPCAEPFPYAIQTLEARNRSYAAAPMGGVVSGSGPYLSLSSLGKLWNGRILAAGLAARRSARPSGRRVSPEAENGLLQALLFQRTSPDHRGS